MPDDLTYAEASRSYGCRHCRTTGDRAKAKTIKEKREGFVKIVNKRRTI